MRKITTVAMAAAAAVSVLLAPQASAVPQAVPAVHTVSAKAAPEAKRCATYKVVGRKVAVRRPANNAHSATSSSPVDHYVHRGDRVRSCLTTFNRGGAPVYYKCGKRGTDYRLVRGGQIPTTCLKRA
jgi:hypothetical protein